MGRNKKEALVFTSIMCFFMVLVMCFYNVILVQGLSGSVFKEVGIAILPALAIALILDVFVVGKVAKGLAHKLIKATDPVIRKVLTISFFMVSGMALCMSLFGSLMHYGFSSDALSRWLPTFGINFIFALPLQMLLVGPLTRFLFIRIYQ
ncbi:DUF2798 domain-containing protein [Paenibacillus sp. sgz500958]|uniref:DUF2798 domain-containing protein n=1 Tax=Paenibacillus sp. sgz500958 TaxID=3242475 RepID=UPI0036D2B43C